MSITMHEKHNATEMQRAKTQGMGNNSKAVNSIKKVTVQDFETKTKVPPLPLTSSCSSFYRIMSLLAGQTLSPAFVSTCHTCTKNESRQKGPAEQKTKCISMLHWHCIFNIDVRAHECTTDSRFTNHPRSHSLSRISLP